MRVLVRLLLLAVLVALGVWLWSIFFQKPKQVIHKQLIKMARLMSFEPNEGSLSRVTAVKRLGRLFAEDVQVVVEVPGMDSFVFNRRDELLQYVLVAKRLGSGLKVEIPDMNIEMGTGNTSALVDLTLKARAGNESDLIVQEFKLTLKKISGDWLVTRVESVKTLKP